MKKLLLDFNYSSPQNLGKSIEIRAFCENDIELQYKFLVIFNGMWTTLQDFSANNICIWNPREEGSYMIMVQAKEKDNLKSYDYLGKSEFVIGREEVNLIKEVTIDRDEIKVGDKVRLKVFGCKDELLYRYWISEDGEWKLLKDYSVEDEIAITASIEGRNSILIESKTPNSENKFDDFKTIDFNISKLEKLEIIDFKCLSKDVLVDEELIFQVDARYDDNRTVLYKFLRIDENGKTYCIQDYSSKRMVSLIEKEAGNYKLLCLAKDMYSLKEYDDRALIVYEVIPYHPIEIKNFTSDLSSPQRENSKILFKAIADGGKQRLYRFIIDGNYGEDTGYIRTSSFLWEPKSEGNYKVTLYVKDETFEGEYEDKKVIEYIIEKRSSNIVKITDVIIDKEKNYLVNETINIKVITEGGSELKYSFIVYKDKKEVSKINYGNINWVNFTPETSGQYEIEIRVKDKYSEKDYDCHQFIFFNVKEYIEGTIDYILMPSKECYLIDDEIKIEAIVQNTRETLIRYVLQIDGHTVEETEFIKSNIFTFKPKRAGKYVIELYAKNIKCQKEFDSKREVKIFVHEAPPITNTKIIADKEICKIPEGITFTVENNGGKDVCYEFYLMERGNWNLVQKYSRKNYYTFMPFSPGTYRLLVLVKSYYKKLAYEDYDNFEFEVVEN